MASFLSEMPWGPAQEFPVSAGPSFVHWVALVVQM